MKNFTDDIKEHALRDAPNEACGIVFRESGVFIARPYPNTFQPENKRPEAFLIDSDEVLRALKTRAVVGVYHSHTNDETNFGPTDKAVANEYAFLAREFSGDNTLLFVSYLYHVPTDKFSLYTPDGERPPLIGRPYVPEIYTCVTQVRDYFEQNLGIASPSFEHTDEDANSGKQTEIAEYFAKIGCKQVTGRLKENDIVLMMLHGARFPNHCGVLIGENFELLHHLYNKVSSVDPYGGFWSKVTCLRFRHPKFF